MLPAAVPAVATLVGATGTLFAALKTVHEMAPARYESKHSLAREIGTRIRNSETRRSAAAGLAKPEAGIKSTDFAKKLAV